MTRTKIYLSVFTLTSVILSGCAHSVVRPTFISPSVLSVTELNDEDKEETYQTKPNEAFQLKSSFSKIEEQGHLPLVIALPDSRLAKESSAHPILVKLRSVEEWKGESTEKYISSQMDSLYIDLLQIITSAKTRDVSTAMRKIDSVIVRFPKLASAYYVRAQVEILAGKTSNAISSLDIALKLRPEFKEAIALHDQLRSKQQ